VMVGVIGLLAQINFPLPWSLVPITGQTLGVLFSGVLLGAWWGGISMLLYALLGAIGLPIFAGWSHGFSIIAGPTGGYIVGFVLTPFITGSLFTNEKQGRLAAIVHKVPMEIEQRVGRLKLKSMSLGIDKLTPEQVDYLASSGEGT